MKFYTIIKNRVKLTFVILNAVLFLFLLGDISFSLYKKSFSESQNYLNLLSSQINFTKSINTYSDVVRDEILIYKNIKLKNYQKNLNQEFKNIAIGISEYQVKEMKEVLNKMYQINKNIKGHLDDQEIQLAQKLFKTEFILYKTKLISLLDSNNKLTVLKFQNHFEEILNLSPFLKFKFVMLLVCLFIAFSEAIFFYKSLINRNRIYLRKQNELEVKESEISTLKEANQLLERNNVYLKENIFNVKRNLIELKGKLNGFDFNETHLNNEDVLLNALSSLERICSSNEKLINDELDAIKVIYGEIKIFNHKVNKINKLTKSLNNSIVNYEINNCPLDLILIKNLNNELKSLNEIDYTDISKNISFEELRKSIKIFEREVTDFIFKNKEIIKDCNALNKKNENKINELHRNISSLEFELISKGGRTCEKFI